VFDSQLVMEAAANGKSSMSLTGSLQVKRQML